MKCRETRTYTLPDDDAHEIARRIEETDLLAAGSPTDWGNMSAALKNMFERTVPVFMNESRSGFPLPDRKGKKP